MENLSQLIDKYDKNHILVVGDVMLDAFIYGSVTRISPESPVPVFKNQTTEIMPGGAANVAANLAALGVSVGLIGLTGNDDARDDLRSLLTEMDVDLQGLLKDPDRPTIRKTRYVAQGQQLLRVDEEEIAPLPTATEQQLVTYITEHADKADLVILSDYAKGVVTPAVIEAIRQTGKPVLVDSKRNDFSKYKNFDVITPNRKELEAATGMPCQTDSQIESAVAQLKANCEIDSVIVTRSEDGLSVFEKDKAPAHIRTKVQDVYDVSGAGDTVIATLAASIVAGATLEQAGRLANKAASIAIAQQGTCIITAEALKATLKYNQASSIAPRLEPENAAQQIKDWQAQGLKVGFTNGCFDILHHGHVSYLDRAKEKCDRLVLGLNHDASVRLLKGNDRPVNDQNARASVIGALGSVDLVVFFGATTQGQDNTPSSLLDLLRPDVMFKGGDYTEDQLPEAKIVRAYGGEVDIMPLYDGYSTTNTILKMKQAS